MVLYREKVKSEYSNKAIARKFGINKNTVANVMVRNR